MKDISATPVSTQIIYIWAETSIKQSRGGKDVRYRDCAGKPDELSVRLPGTQITTVLHMLLWTTNGGYDEVMGVTAREVTGVGDRRAQQASHVPDFRVQYNAHAS